MQETIFKLHLKKWKEALAILDTNTSNLHADELEAIGALKNLWRTVSFGSSCTQRVERMVKVLSDADKLHGNNRDIIQASKDFRGVAKEMYTTDAETLEQFRNALQQTMGGPRRTTQRPIRQPQQAYQQPRQQPQQRPQQPLRRQPQQRPASEPRYSRKPSSSAEIMRQARREERIRRLKDALRQHLPTVAVSIGLVALIVFGCFALFRAYSTVSPADWETLFSGNWHGELHGNPATLIVDSVMGDSVEGRLLVKEKTLQKHAVAGHVEQAREGQYLYLAEVDQQQYDKASSVGNSSEGASSDSLITRYRLFVSNKSHRLAGLRLQGATTAALDLRKEGSDTLPGPRHHASITADGPTQYIVNPLVKDSIRCIRVQRDPKQQNAWKPSADGKSIYLLRGELLDSVPQVADGNRLVFVSQGKYYRIQRSNLLWSQTNRPDTTRELTLREQQRHSALTAFFASVGPCWMIIGLLAVSFLICITAMRLDVTAVRRAGLIVVPLCLLAVAIIEIYWYHLMGTQAFWWIDYDRYGFFGTLLRVIPFLIVVAVQLLSIRWYELLLSDDFDDKLITIKPAVIGIVVSFAAIIVYALLMQFVFHWTGDTAEQVGFVLFLLIILIGIVITFRRNIQRLGWGKGSLISCFVLVYAVSCIIAVVALIIVIVRIILIILAALFILGALAGAGGAGSGRIYRDSSGHLYRRI
jgi:hypothetical protein